MLRVAIQTQGESPKVVEFPYDRRISFGRAPDNDIVLPPAYVSRHHGEFVFEEDCWWLVDRGSLTGIAIAGPDGSRRRITSGGRERISGGESIEILHTVLRVDVKPLESLVPVEADDWWEATQGASVATMTSVRLESVRGLQGDLASDARKLEMLFELAKDLNQAQSTDAVLQRIGATVFELLPGASHFSVCVADRSGGFAPQLGLLRGGQRVPTGQIEVSRSLLDWVVTRQMALLYQPGTTSTLTRTVVLRQIVSSMAIPLHGARGTVGVMLVDNRTGEPPFSEPDLNLMIVLASSAAGALERARLEAEIERMFNGFVEASVTAIEARDPPSGGHSRRVADYTLALADAVNRSLSPNLAPFRLSEVQLRELSYAALLHDFGKVGVPECVLQKAERLYPQQTASIEARFSEHRLLRQNALVAAACGAHAARGGNADERLAAVRLQISDLTDELESALALIRRASRRGVLEPAEREQLEALSRQRFVDVEGRERTLLEPDEFAALCIQTGTLGEEERRQIESHVLESQRFLQQIPWSSELERIPQIVVGHHEKLDGSGYPFRRCGAQILPQARMLTVCDIFDAITAADRPYRSAMPYERALDELHALARTGRIEQSLVDLFSATRPWERTRRS